MNTQNSARLKLIGVLAIFLVPLGGAYMLYYGLSYGGAQTNNGVLVSPAQPLPSLMLNTPKGRSVPAGKIFERRWTILQVAGQGCGEPCRQSLAETRQVRALLHRRASRVQRILFVANGRAPPKLDRQPDLAVYRTDTDRISQILAQENAGQPGVVYLVDPLGNWMLYYPPSGDGSALFEDLKHLLKLSHIG